MMNSNFTETPQNLPVPIDDGAADHLKGKGLPKITLPSTAGGTVALASLTGRFVIYIYPMTGRPGVPLPDGWGRDSRRAWMHASVCSFRDHHLELSASGVDVFGLSTQDTEYQREVRETVQISVPIAQRQLHELPFWVRFYVVKQRGLSILYLRFSFSNNWRYMAAALLSARGHRCRSGNRMACAVWWLQGVRSTTRALRRMSSLRCLME